MNVIRYFFLRALQGLGVEQQLAWVDRTLEQQQLRPRRPTAKTPVAPHTRPTTIPLTPDSLSSGLERLERVFHMFDEDKNDNLDFGEFCKCAKGLRSLHLVGEDELQRLFGKYSSDEGINLECFQHAISEKLREMCGSTASFMQSIVDLVAVRKVRGWMWTESMYRTSGMRDEASKSPLMIVVTAVRAEGRKRKGVLSDVLYETEQPTPTAMKPARMCISMFVAINANPATMSRPAVADVKAGPTRSTSSPPGREDPTKHVVDIV